MNSMFNSFYRKLKLNQLIFKSALSFVLVLFCFQGISQTTDLLISEYGEGSGNNKFVEIYNGTGAAVNLANYEVWRISNGGAWPEATIALSGMLADGDVYVVSNPSASAAILAVTDLTSGNCSWNGDDAVGLAKDIATVMTLIDAVGTNGADPGSGWDVAGTTNGTADNTIIRKPDICSPNTNWTTSAGTNTTNSEWTVFASDYISDLGSHTNTCVVSTNTITPGAVTGANFSVQCASSDNGSIAFTSTGTFNAGNVFTAQLSDAAGAFGSPTDIGTLSANGLDPSGTINFAIPAATATGANYVIRIRSSDPFTTSATNSASFTITLTDGPCVFTPPHLTGVIINSCDGSCNEGDNELVFGNSGDYSIDVTAANFNFLYGSPNPPTANYTDVLVTNPTTTAAINTAAGCAGTYVEGTGATIPPNSSFILASTNLCTDALTWDGLCGTGPIYVIYQNDATWMTSGNFSNSTAAGSRYFRTTITTTDATTHTIDYEYDRAQNAGSDGDFVTYGPNGGAPFSYLDDDCQIEPSLVLPIQLISFQAKKQGNTALLDWTVASERNALEYQIERFSAENEFEYIGTVGAAGNSLEQLNYSFVDQNPLLGINYYRLKLIDFDGSYKYTYVRSVTFDQSKLEIFQSGNNVITMNQLIEQGKFEVYNTAGQLVQSGVLEGTNQFALKHNFQTGIYLLNVSSGSESITEKLFIK